MRIFSTNVTDSETWERGRGFQVASDNVGERRTSTHLSVGPDSPVDFSNKYRRNKQQKKKKIICESVNILKILPVCNANKIVKDLGTTRY